MKKQLPVLRCINYKTLEVIEYRCSRKHMRKLASMYGGKKFRFRDIKIIQVNDFAYNNIQQED